MTLRCAVYTRKSSEEGLDQSFNSLHAQREACENYIKSQCHEDWRILPKIYEDGGISGGTMKRPGLLALLADIEAGRVDMVVVYKVDRLSRSLSDFAKMIDRIEEAGASFVSVTQSFNTATSMGKLTLNMLLSFAQFERDVTAERIRDKIAASKAKSMWMGGSAPLGYVPFERTLKIHKHEAAQVIRLYTVFAETGCIKETLKAAHREQILSKARRFKSGRKAGGQTMSPSRLYYILSIPTYLGKIRHKDLLHEGLHEAIIPNALWDRVQAHLNQKTRSRQKSLRQTLCPLTGRLYGDDGTKLKTSHTRKGERRYRYYVSDTSTETGLKLRLPAHTFDALVQEKLQHWIKLRDAKKDLLNARNARAIKRTKAKLERLMESEECLTVLARVTVTETTLTFEIAPEPLAAHLEIEEEALNREALSMTCCLEMRRRGVELKLLSGDSETVATDETLKRLLIKARSWLEQIKTGTSLKSIADKEGVTHRFIGNRIHLAWLAPEIQAAILEGKAPPHLSSETLIRTKMPLDWAEQKARLGFKTAV